VVGSIRSKISPEQGRGRQEFVFSHADYYESRPNASGGRLQVGADALHDRHDRDRDAGGHEAVFDSRCTGLVLQKTRYKAWTVSSGCNSVA
jgi:hypothetical protein